jgi:hypothetical protein
MESEKMLVCPACDEEIEEGDEMVEVAGETVHADCADSYGQDLGEYFMDGMRER